MTYKAPKKPSQRRPVSTKELITGLSSKTIADLAKLSPLKVSDQEGPFGLFTLGMKRPREKGKKSS